MFGFGVVGTGGRQMAKPGVVVVVTLGAGEGAMGVATMGVLGMEESIIGYPGRGFVVLRCSCCRRGWK